MLVARTLEIYVVGEAESLSWPKFWMVLPHQEHARL